MLKVVNVVGARPNFVKIAPIVDEMKTRRDHIQQVLVHTGQHYDDAMSEAFFRDLEIPKADINLGIGSGSHTQQTAGVMLAFEPVVEREKPDWVVVTGDVNSTFACAFVACRCGIRVAHVEAGLRSFDRTMPEEFNRILTDQLSDLLLTPSGDADENLAREGIPKDRIVRVGNVMIDSLLRALSKTKNSLALERLHLKPREYAVVTMHRPSNVDDPIVLAELIKALEIVSEQLPVIIPLHPRTRANLSRFGINPLSQVHVIEPLGYLDFLALLSQARLALTDSGGIQEETTVLGIPCLTMRENTERPVTVTHGTNVIVGRDPQRIIDEARAALARSPDTNHTTPELWDGRAAKRIVDALLSR